ncbi:MAG: hypothetical protein RBU25_18085, partial [Lentisphaeria bacterium]|nr:hypothetical protein [Lentisphaeria bacterium]
MNAHIVGHLGHDHGPEEILALEEELALVLDDALGDALDGGLALVDGPQQQAAAGDLLADILLDLRR